MRGNTLVTGGSDGSVRVWSLERMCPIHRLAAHDNSVTSLQFDDTRVVSGGSDGRVKIWDLKTGHLVRELIAQGEAVWRVAFEEEKCVALALRHGRTVMEVTRSGPTLLQTTWLTRRRFGAFLRRRRSSTIALCHFNSASSRTTRNDRRAPDWNTGRATQPLPAPARTRRRKTSTCRTPALQRRRCKAATKLFSFHKPSTFTGQIRPPEGESAGSTLAQASVERLRKWLPLRRSPRRRCERFAHFGIMGFSRASGYRTRRESEDSMLTALRLYSDGHGKTGILHQLPFDGDSWARKTSSEAPTVEAGQMSGWGSNGEVRCSARMWQTHIIHDRLLNCAEAAVTVLGDLNLGRLPDGRGSRAQKRYFYK